MLRLHWARKRTFEHLLGMRVRAAAAAAAHLTHICSIRSPCPAAQGHQPGSTAKAAAAATAAAGPTARLLPQGSPLKDTPKHSLANYWLLAFHGNCRHQMHSLGSTAEQCFVRIRGPPLRNPIVTVTNLSVVRCCGMAIVQDGSIRP
jgi:hypothetical protein